MSDRANRQFVPKAKAVALGIGVLAAVTAGLLLYRHHLRSKWPPPESLAFASRAAKEIAAAPSARAGDATAVLGILETLTARGEAVPPDRKVRLLTMLAEFCAARAGGDPTRYEAWMSSRGWRIREAAPEWDDITAAHRHYAGPGSSPHASLLDHFRFCFEQSHARDRGGAALVEVAGGTGSGQMLFAMSRDADLPLSHAFNIEELDPRWVGQISTSTRKHWRPPIEAEEVRRRDGEVLLALVNLGAGDLNGDWRPLTLVSFFDPVQKQWHLHEIYYQNSFSVKGMFEW